MRSASLLLLFLLTGLFASATHNRAGEITYRWVGQTWPNDKTYEITITTYTKTSSNQADRPSLDSVHLGDGHVMTFHRDDSIELPNDIKYNRYTEVYTYQGNGIFKIHFTDPNRNGGVINIPNSINVPFYLETTLVINPSDSTANSSPVLTYPPIDRGCVGRIFIHNPSAFDPDDDSLSYELVVCGGLNGAPVPGYSFPAAANSFSIDPVTGDLIWDYPVMAGEYNVAFEIRQWLRNGVLRGVVRRDMQITIGQCNNNPPDIDVISDTCVLAGDTLRFDVTGIDPDGHNVQMSATGGMFPPSTIQDQATFTPLQPGTNDTVTYRFDWPTQCHHIRKHPYYAQFRAIDQIPGDTTTALVNLKGTFIRVIGPPPLNPVATAAGNSIVVNWDPPACPGVTEYRIYRRNGLYNGTIECPCDNGAPAYTGYTLIGMVDDAVTTYTDDNNGQGLVIGIQYCYIIVAVYGGNSESCASSQTCASLIKDLPVITNADVRHTDAASGSIYVAWSKPTQLDSIQYPGPYQYILYHSPDFTGGNFTQIATMNSLDDTTFVDSLINTNDNPWSYKVELYYTSGGTLTLKGSTTNASSVYLTISPSDNRLNLSWQFNVPWTNNSYDIFRQDPVTLNFDSIATTTATQYTDSGLANGNTYCYFIRSSGSYFFSGFIDPIINRSQQTCGVPVDNVYPCSPDLTVASDCGAASNVLVWTNPNNICADDVLGYNVYFKPGGSSGYELIVSVSSPFDTTFIHPDLPVIAGCYKVTAVDSVGNETIEPVEVCVDTCRQYVLPSVFTPNGDGNNDLFHPCDTTTSQELQVICPPYKNVKSVDMKIFNRWGQLVFETDNIDINWDGRHKDSGTDCPEGVYFYSCKVGFFRLEGEDLLELNGTIQLIRE